MHYQKSGTPVSKIILILIVKTPEVLITISNRFTEYKNFYMQTGSLAADFTSLLKILFVTR